MWVLVSQLHTVHVHSHDEAGHDSGIEINHDDEDSDHDSHEDGHDHRD